MLVTTIFSVEIGLPVAFILFVVFLSRARRFEVYAVVAHNKLAYCAMIGASCSVLVAIAVVHAVSSYHSAATYPLIMYIVAELAANAGKLRVCTALKSAYADSLST